MPRVNGIRMLTKHKKDCRALRRTADEYPLLYFSCIMWLDKAGRSVRGTNRRQPWFVFGCFAPGCGGEFAVREDLLLRFAHQKMLEAEEARRG